MYMHTYDRCHVVFFLINVDRHGHLTGPQISPSTKKNDINDIGPEIELYNVMLYKKTSIDSWFNIILTITFVQI